ncbi:MAG: glycoside hydrolase family 18 protein [Bacteroidales bacterium]|nr:glycoside hydrolase family 18 protein [Candidatus Cacconaster merdequi]
MRLNSICTRALAVTAALLLIAGCSAGQKTFAPGQRVRPQDMVVASYVTSWTTVMPDPNLLTHINYAFAHVTSTFDGVRIDNEERLRDIVELKRINPDLKVVLSIGGWGSGNFSEMAADQVYRRKFAKACARTVRKFRLDGIDLDWEYPTNGKGAHISESTADRDNFTKLIVELRKALGPKKVISLASCCDPKYYDFKAIVPYMDFINIMTYDMEEGATHHCALYLSDRTAAWSADRSVREHILAGVPVNKIVMGVPFFGRGKVKIPGGGSFKNLRHTPEGYYSRWDNQAQCPYLVDRNGNFIMGYENEQSLEVKCRYIKVNGLRGIMNWEYGGDDENLTLTRIMHSLVY